jgi:FixJ family two-component response regulator
MPEMHGPELADRLTAQRPDLPVVFVSGYSHALRGTNARKGRVAFLAKPFSAADMIATVEAVLAAPTA